MLVVRGLTTLTCWYAAAVLAIWVWIGTLPNYNSDGTCEGIGFGCNPSPHATATIVAVIVGLPLLFVSVPVSCVGLAVAVVAGIRSGVVAGSLATFAGIAVAVAILVVIVLIHM
jgi:hypothetical protein